MLIIFYVGMYLLTGVLAIFGCSFIHLYKAEKDGYAALEWWLSDNPVKDAIMEKTGPVEVLWGIVIWPARLYDFMYVTVPMLMEQYELKSDYES